MQEVLNHGGHLGIWRGVCCDVRYYFGTKVMFGTSFLQLFVSPVKVFSVVEERKTSTLKGIYPLSFETRIFLNGQPDSDVDYNFCSGDFHLGAT
jgi:hypothetical protein